MSEPTIEEIEKEARYHWDECGYGPETFINIDGAIDFYLAGRRKGQRVKESDATIAVLTPSCASLLTRAEQAEAKVKELEAELAQLNEKFPSCGHRKVDWDDSYGHCAACSMKEYADKYDDQLGFELRVKELEEGIRKHRKINEAIRIEWNDTPYEATMPYFDTELYKLIEQGGNKWIEEKL